METVKARKAKSHAFGKDIYYHSVIVFIKIRGKEKWKEQYIIVSI